MKTEFIENYSIFDTQVVGLTIIPIDETDPNTGDQLYCSVMDIMLEYDEENLENKKHISIITNAMSSDINQLVVVSVNALSMLFANISNNVLVLDNDGNVCQQIDLNEFFSEQDTLELSDNESISLTDKKYLH